MKLYGRSVTLAVVFLWLLPPLGATTVARLDLDGLVDAADAVVSGTVRNRETFWSSDGRLILTRHLIEVQETLKGAPSSTIEVTTIGGEIGALTLHVAGMAVFETGEQVVVFVEDSGTHRLVVGLGQGKFTVRGGVVSNDVSQLQFADGSPGRSTRMALDDFKERIRSRLAP